FLAAQAHDRAFAKLLFNLRHRQVNCPHFFRPFVGHKVAPTRVGERYDLGDIYHLKYTWAQPGVSARMLLNFHRIPASGEYSRKANKRRTRIADFHTFAEPLSATLWKILWIERDHPPSRRRGRRVNFLRITNRCSGQGSWTRIASAFCTIWPHFAC